MGKSAHREMQDAVQAAYNRGVADTVAGVIAYLEDRKERLEFAAVLVAFKADWVGEADDALKTAQN